MDAVFIAVLLAEFFWRRLAHAGVWLGDEDRAVASEATWRAWDMCA